MTTYKSFPESYIGMDSRNYDELLANGEITMLTMRKDIKLAQLFPVYLGGRGQKKSRTEYKVLVMDIEAGQLPGERAVRLKIVGFRT